MSFEKLILPDFILASIYKNNIVLVQNDSKTAQVKNQKNTLEKKWYLGENKKKVFIAVQDESAVFLRDEWLQFLSSILTACHLNIGDVAIVNMANFKIPYKEAVEALQPNYFILFDINIQQFQLPFIVQEYHVQQFNQAQFLLSASLNKMQSNTPEAKLEKTKLWTGLKKMFGI